ncbi:MAG: hypothetical protein IJU44_01005 [Kiritimatiellae bacterium]|nr:hypothetical protein [Kiritimatiellia bacterium]
MANEKYQDPNPFSDYGPAMASTPDDPMAFEWQNANNAKLAEATTPKALASYVWDQKDAEALLARVKGAYESDPMDLTIIAAVTQYVMEAMIGRPNGCQKRCGTPGASPCQRKTWNLALIAAYLKSKDEYVQTFMLDQLRWCACACGCRRNDLLKLRDAAVSEHVRSYAEWVIGDIK